MFVYCMYDTPTQYVDRLADVHSISSLQILFRVVRCLEMSWKTSSTSAIFQTASPA